MPYFTRRMAKYLELIEGRSKHKSRHHKEKKLKISAVESKLEDQLPAPSHPGATGFTPSPSEAKSGTPSKEALPSYTSSSGVSKEKSATSGLSPAKSQVTEELDLKKLKFLRDCIKAEVERIKKSRGAISVDKRFKKYQIYRDQVIYEAEMKKMYKTKHASYPENTLICQEITFPDDTDMNTISDLAVFKILRHIGKKHPFIIQTWDIYANNQQIYLFQEWANRGDMVAYVNKHGPVNEQQGGKWAYHIFKALDYLGDIGVSHRSIQPQHVLLSSKELKAKLTDFAEAVIYWDPNEERIVNVQCLLRPTQPETNFQAPEVYGNPDEEEFDPVAADVWSYGATIFYALTGNYPYDVSVDPNQIDQSVKATIESVQVSNEAKNIFSKTLAIDVDSRCSLNDLRFCVYYEFHFKR